MKKLICITLLFCCSAFSQQNLPEKSSPVLTESNVTIPSAYVEPLTREEIYRTQSPPRKLESMQPSMWNGDLYQDSLFISVGVGLSNANKIKLNNLKISNGISAATFQGTWEWDTATSLQIDVGTKHTGLGWMVGFEYESERNSESLTITGPGGTTGRNSVGSTLTLMSTRAELLYNMKTRYIRAGLNYSYPDIHIPEVSYDLEGSFGFQVGFGFLVDEHIGFDLSFKRSHFSGNISDGNSTMDSDKMRFDGTTIALKYRF